MAIGQVHTAIIIDHHSIVEEISTKLINLIRAKICQVAAERNLSSETDKFDFLVPLDAELMRAGKEVLLEKKKISRVIYQPEVLKSPMMPCITLKRTLIFLQIKS